MNLLAEEELPLVVAARCKGLIRALSQVKPHSATTNLRQDHEIFSHPLDALRYLLFNVVPDGGYDCVSCPSVPASQPLRQRSGPIM